MLAEKTGISFGEDALSTCYSTETHSDSSGTIPFSSPPSLTASSNNSSSSFSSRNRRGGSILSFFKFRWLGFGGSDDEMKRRDIETVNEVIEFFRKNDVDGMRNLLEEEHFPFDGEDEFWWDDKEMKSVPKPILKPTPHFKKLIPSHVRKAVRFNKDYTPEERPARPFTPLYTSTPKNAVEEDEDSDDEEIPSLRNCDSNTVMPPYASLNNTSSILLANHNSVLESWNKSRQQTNEALRRSTDNSTAQSHYKVCYDDTDEEEVVEDEEKARGVIAPTPLRTFVVSKEESSPSKTSSLHEQSFELEINTSTDSSVVLGLDRIEDHIQSLEDEIIAANRFGRDKDVARGHGAIRHAQVLQERLAQMIEALNEMCGKFAHHESSPDDDCGADGDKKGISAAFEDSCWAERLDFEVGSFDANQV